MWHTMMSQIAPRSKSGAYLRPESQFRHWVRAKREDQELDSGNMSYLTEAGRYHLYVGMGCPWAHRTLVVRALKGLAESIPVTVVEPSVNDGGWVFEDQTQASARGCRTLKEFYRLAQTGYDGRSTVPVLWDSQTQTIVNNESAEIIEILNGEFDAIAQNPSLNLYPDALKPIIDDWNKKIYHAVNNGVYRCGFAQSQVAYDQACDQLFAMLDDIDTALTHQRYLCGPTVTLADVRLFTTLFRFDIVYYGLFKCNRRRIQDYANLGPYLRDMYQLPGVAETCDLDAVKRDYYGNLFPLNPGQIIPRGPDIDNLWDQHGRDLVGSQIPGV
ncbi:MAG: glutathione S-transferase family protein [Cyanobacteria bacterium P01_F01_bin.150]